MKKIILAIAITACFASQVNAQFKFGLKGGVNFENFKLKNASEQLKFNNAVGWQAGALLQIKIPANGIGVQPELLYTVKKANVDNKSNSIHYFEVPINAIWSFNLLIVRPYLMAGPYFSYAVNSKGGVFDSKLDKFDWGIGLGGGVEIWKLQLGARYSWGLQDVGVRDFKMRNNTFTASLAYLF